MQFEPVWCVLQSNQIQSFKWILETITMQTISLRLPEHVMNEVKTFAETQKMKLSDYLRHLISLGLKVEKASQNSTGEKSNALGEIQEAQFKNSVETLYLSRMILNAAIDQMGGKLDHKSPEELIDLASKESHAFVKKFLKK